MRVRRRQPSACARLAWEADTRTQAKRKQATLSALLALEDDTLSPVVCTSFARHVLPEDTRTWALRKRLPTRAPHVQAVDTRTAEKHRSPLPCARRAMADDTLTAEKRRSPLPCARLVMAADTRKPAQGNTTPVRAWHVMLGIIQGRVAAKLPLRSVRTAPKGFTKTKQARRIACLVCVGNSKI